MIYSLISFWNFLCSINKISPLNRKTATDANSDLILDTMNEKKRAKVDVIQNGELHTEILESDR